jgi:preprotein translocase subunit SecA
MATITIQNYFRLYEKLGGMTGTAKTEEKEFVEIYGLNVVEIPTNVPVSRLDKNDLIFKTKEARFAAVIQDIKERHEKGQPVLLGTIAVETSEYISELLKRNGIKHEVLNAKAHEREAEIIAGGGQRGAVTIATNMAGRGVDIKLGVGMRELCGLFVLGTERHESRRIDNQLRGRSGRQGDPGETRFYLSAQDELVRLFAGDRIYKIIDRFKLPDDQPMEASILSKQIENAQKKVEEQNFVARKNVLKYDDVMNLQRMVIYEQRRRVLEGQDMSEELRAWVAATVERVIRQHLAADDPSEWDLDQLVAAMQQVYRTTITAEELREEVELDDQAIIDEFVEDALDEYAAKEEALGPELMRELERFVLLQVVDHRWREHLENMEYLREGVHLRAMAQKDPLVEYRREGHAMFETLSLNIREEVVILIFHAELVAEDAQDLQQIQEEQAADQRGMQYEHESTHGSQAIAQALGGADAGSYMEGDDSAITGLLQQEAPAAPQRVLDDQDKIGRNDPCWCGSGKKFKKCHGAA